MIRLIIRLLMVGVCMLVVLGVTARWAHRQTQKVPEFYEQAIEPVAQRSLTQSSQQLQAGVKQLEDDVIENGRWQAEFRSDQINAWLAEEFPKRMPQLASKGLSDPRILIEKDSLTIAARFKDMRLDTILSCRLNVQVTDQPNRLAIAVEGIWAGALPLPLSQFQERVETLTSRTHLDLQWETRDGETIALINLPAPRDRDDGEATVIECVELAEDQIILAGQTGPASRMAYAPEGPVYKLAALMPPTDDQVVPPTLNVHGSEGTSLPLAEQSSLTKALPGS